MWVHEYARAYTYIYIYIYRIASAVAACRGTISQGRRGVSRVSLGQGGGRRVAG